MHLGKNNPKYSYTMGGYAPAGVVLATSTKEKDVGVMISDNLKPAAQVAKAVTKANQVLGQMTRAFHYQDKSRSRKEWSTWCQDCRARRTRKG